MHSDVLRYGLLSGLRVLMLAALLAASLGTALAVGLVLARMGQLGTCQDGTCELVAAVYVMPIGGVVLYFSALFALSRFARSRRSRTDA